MKNFLKILLIYGKPLKRSVLDIDKFGWLGQVAHLRAETAMTVKWIAQRLAMGALGYVNHLVYLRRKARKTLYANIKN